MDASYDSTITRSAIPVQNSGALTFADVLPELRKLPLEDYTRIMFSQPADRTSALELACPPMASAAVQKRFTGACGAELQKQTCTFVRTLLNAYGAFADKPRDGAKVLDVGFGYGRLLRMMYRYTDPCNVYGVDPWAHAHAECDAANLPGHRALSVEGSSSLPFEGHTFDLIYAFSVLTHLNEPTARALFAGIRERIEPTGLLVITVRPPEFWSHRDGWKKTNHAAALIAQHQREGFAFQPDDFPSNHYGHTSMSRSYLRSILPDWTVVPIEPMPEDPYQVPVALLPV